MFVGGTKAQDVDVHGPIRAGLEIRIRTWIADVNHRVTIEPLVVKDGRSTHHCVNRCLRICLMNENGLAIQGIGTASNTVDDIGAGRWLTRTSGTGHEPERTREFTNNGHGNDVTSHQIMRENLIYAMTVVRNFPGWSKWTVVRFANGHVKVNITVGSALEQIQVWIGQRGVELVGIEIILKDKARRWHKKAIRKVVVAIREGVDGGICIQFRPFFSGRNLKNLGQECIKGRVTELNEDVVAFGNVACVGELCAQSVVYNADLRVAVCSRMNGPRPNDSVHVSLQPGRCLVVCSVLCVHGERAVGLIQGGLKIVALCCELMDQRNVLLVLSVGFVQHGRKVAHVLIELCDVRSHARKRLVRLVAEIAHQLIQHGDLRLCGFPLGLQQSNFSLVNGCVRLSEIKRHLGCLQGELDRRQLSNCFLMLGGYRGNLAFEFGDFIILQGDFIFQRRDCSAIGCIIASDAPRKGTCEHQNAEKHG